MPSVHPRHYQPRGICKIQLCRERFNLTMHETKEKKKKEKTILCFFSLILNWLNKMQPGLGQTLPLHSCSLMVLILTAIGIVSRRSSVWCWGRSKMTCPITVVYQILSEVTERFFISVKVT